MAQEGQISIAGVLVGGAADGIRTRALEDPCSRPRNIGPLQTSVTKSGHAARRGPHMADVIAEMEACIPALRRYASGLLRDRQEADDLVQHCLLLALDRLRTRREHGQMRTWLFTILHNLFISQAHRPKMRDITVPVDVADEAAFGKDPSGDDFMHSRDLMDALERLTKEQRTVLLLVAVEDLSYAEVARIVGVPIGTVMARLSCAREALRREACVVSPSALRRVN
jgi:RNA polymerase sigma factor (sigma-70 family)